MSRTQYRDLAHVPRPPPPPGNPTRYPPFNSILKLTPHLALVVRVGPVLHPPSPSLRMLLCATLAPPSLVPPPCLQIQVTASNSSRRLAGRVLQPTPRLLPSDVVVVPTFTVSVTGGSAGVNLTLPSLPDGVYTFEVHAVDVAGYVRPGVCVCVSCHTGDWCVASGLTCPRLGVV